MSEPLESSRVTESKRCRPTPVPAGAGFVRFLAAGVVIYTISCTLTLALFHGLELSRFVAYGLTHICLPFIAFVVNRQWTFRATGDARGHLLRFLIANSAFRVVDWCLYAIVSVLLEPPIAVAIIIANSAMLPAKFFYYKHRVFRSDSGAT